MKKQEIPAFTLIECLIGLMIVSSILLSFNLLIQQTIQVSDFLQRKDQKEWLIFLAQLEEELNSSHNVSVKNQQLHYTVEDKQYIIERYQTMIRKRRTSGGHQPMLTSITEPQLLEKEVGSRRLLFLSIYILFILSICACLVSCDASANGFNCLYIFSTSTLCISDFSIIFRTVERTSSL